MTLVKEMFLLHDPSQGDVPHDRYSSCMNLVKEMFLLTTLVKELFFLHDPCQGDLPPT